MEYATLCLYAAIQFFGRRRFKPENDVSRELVSEQALSPALSPGSQINIIIWRQKSTNEHYFSTNCQLR